MHRKPVILGRIDPRAGAPRVDVPLHGGPCAELMSADDPTLDPVAQGDNGLALAQALAARAAPALLELKGQYFG